MGAEKQKVKQSERDQAALAKAVTDKGNTLNATHVSASKADIGYKNNGANSSKASAANALAMKSAVKQSRGKGANSIATNTVNATRGNAEQFGITARSGLSNIERQAQGAQSGVRSAQQTLGTGNALVQQDRAKEHASWVNSNQNKQGLMDLAAMGITSAAGEMWDAQASGENDYVDTPVNYTHTDPMDFENPLTRVT